jgi:hypothetical protein
VGALSAVVGGAGLVAPRSHPQPQQRGCVALREGAGAGAHQGRTAAASRMGAGVAAAAPRRSGKSVAQWQQQRW